MMFLPSVANDLCLKVPAAPPRGAATAAALFSASNGAQCPCAGHPTLAGHGIFAGHAQISHDVLLQHLWAGESLCAQGCHPCQNNLGLPGLAPEKKKVVWKKGPKQLWQLPLVSPASLLEEGQPCFITHPFAARLVWWVRCYGATRKGSSGLHELSGRSTDWTALKWPQQFSVL